MKRILRKTLKEFFDEIGLSDILSKYNNNVMPLVFFVIGIISVGWGLKYLLKYKKIKENTSKMYLISASYLILIGLVFLGLGVFYI